MKQMMLIFVLFISFQSYAGEGNMFLVIDVRTPDEYNYGHVQGAQLIDFYNRDFLKELAKLDKSKHYKLYCRSGNRSGQAQRIMEQLGFKKVDNLGSMQEAMHTLKRQCEGKAC